MASPWSQELAARKDGGSWIVLGQNLTPEFQVTSGIRRLSQQQISPLKELNVALTPEVVEREKWNAFWDSPLMVPGRPGTNLDLPRKPDESQACLGEISRHRLPGEDRRSAFRGNFPGLEAGRFLRLAAIHRVSRDEPAAAGSDRQDHRALGRLQVHRRPERIRNHGYQPAGLARHGSRMAAIRIRRRANQDPVGSSPQSARDTRSQRRIARRLSAVAQVFLLARNRNEPRLRLLPQGRRDILLHRRAPAGSGDRRQAMGHLR